jgi:beta-phosphoglucomutase
MGEIHACIFDLDGVIVDTARYHYLAWKRLADELGIKFTERDNERLKGVSRMTSLDIILDLGKKSFNNDRKELFAAMKNRWYNDYINIMTPAELLPGTMEFINELKEAGIPIAIGSASKNTPLILERLGIKNLFNAVADGNNVKKAKPDPEVFLKAAEMLNVEPGRCIVFEDAVAGIQAAINAGMMCVGIGSASILKDARYVVKGLSEMSIEKLKEIEQDSKG